MKTKINDKEQPTRPPLTLNPFHLRSTMTLLGHVLENKRNIDNIGSAAKGRANQMFLHQGFNSFLEERLAVGHSLHNTHGDTRTFFGGGAGVGAGAVGGIQKNQMAQEY